MNVWHVDLRRSRPSCDGIAALVDDFVAAQRRAGHDASAVTEPHARALAGRPDVVHLHSVFRPQHAALARWCRMRGIPYVTQPHSGLAGDALARQAVRKQVYLRAAERSVLGHAAAVVCNTEVEAGEVGRVVGSARTVVIPNAVVTAGDVRPAWRPPTRARRASCASRATTCGRRGSTG